MTHLRLAALVFALVVIMPIAALAQDMGEDPAENARIRLGALSFTPRLAVRNLGVDSNIFNTSANPVRDNTVSISPDVDAWLRIGRGLISSKTSVDWALFGDYKSQNSTNFNQEARLDVDLLRVVPYGGGAYLSTRQRPNDEIDVRIHQIQTGGFFGLGTRLGSRLRVDVGARQTRFDFSEGQYGDPDYANALNRRLQEASVDVAYAVTPLTSVVVRSAGRTDTFQYSNLRDSDSVSIMPGLKFKPLALVSGTAYMGYRWFTTKSAEVPDYSGLVADMELQYLARDMTKVIGRVQRDVDYSLDDTQPFFVASSVALELTQAIGLEWDMVGRLRRGALAYQQTDPLIVPTQEHVLEAGAGIGRRLGTYVRVGLDVDFTKRTSNRPGRAFEGYRVGGSVTYGY